MVIWIVVRPSSLQACFSSIKFKITPKNLASITMPLIGVILAATISKYLTNIALRLVASVHGNRMKEEFIYSANTYWATFVCQALFPGLLVRQSTTKPLLSGSFNELQISSGKKNGASSARETWSPLGVLGAPQPLPGWCRCTGCEGEVGTIWNMKSVRLTCSFHHCTNTEAFFSTIKKEMKVAKFM